ncbi:polysaccharide deacetylase family protein [Halalkalibacter alkaliphilus]|uniref:Polysaccharide deacetylase family protein n=1 Tax=Halalkalibacter alkaliphilus TaxID=2917993 RepID=A0A9X2CPI9_9BACI|nr:polysaccharide deacetylase family protein [Halalkalibacter alkaliphilus]MCL7746307.1 polysaccharide deacetylase family protein [Halalkalibacter alkaliphilus]
MKRLLIMVILFIMSLFMLVGCQNDHVESEVEVEEEIEEKVKEEEGRGVEPVQEEELESVDVESEVLNEIEKKYTINKTNWLVEPIDDASDQVVLITIDDAPEHYSVAMAEILKRLEAGAIFFVNGHFLQTEEDREKLKRIHELGFEIGNHTMTHPNMSQLSREDQKNEIIQLNRLIEGIIGERPRFYRAPFGVNTETSNEVVEAEGMQSMNWTYGYDWENEYQEADALADIMVNSPLLTKGANLLMHDRMWTKEALEDIVIGLREQGYEIVHPNEIATN